MKYYTETDVKGNIIAFYNDEIHGKSIPETAMLITIEQWQTFSANANLYKRDGDVIREKTQQEIDAELAAQPTPPPSLEDKVSEVTGQAQILDERTIGMQDIDYFTLQSLQTTEERTAGMQDIDEFTLTLVFEMQATIDQMRAEIDQLKGGA